jgi:twinkle protein
MGSESEFLQHEPCPACGSSDNLARYTDGHGHCFGCKHYEHGEGNEKKTARSTRVSGLIEGEYKSLKKRGINEDTCKKFGYQVGTHNGRTVHIAPFHNDKGQVVAQHIRYNPKDFTWLGEAKKGQLFGQHLWRDGGKQVVITEGELDCLSISQLWGNKWPVVSIKSGSSGAKKDIEKSVEWLEQFEHVILCFDNDKAGQAALESCTAALSPGRIKVAKLPLKDANEMLLAGREKELLDALWGAKTYRPDGIVSAADVWELVVKEEDHGELLYPWDGLNNLTHGPRVGEVTTLCAGSGIGKSAVCREIAADLITKGESVGYIALEESVQRSIRGLLSIAVNRPLHLPSVRRSVPEDQLRAAWEGLKDKAFFYDHWGSVGSDNLLNRIRYLARGCLCRWVVLDHISIVVSGDGEGDERRKIDNLMTSIRSLVEELRIGMLLVSHLKRPDGKGHEEGAATSLAQLRGSAAIAQLSDIVIGMERNQQDEEAAHITTVRVLKNRYTGETGVACALSYDKETGRLTEVNNNPFFEEETNGTATAPSTQPNNGAGVADY